MDHSLAASRISIGPPASRQARSRRDVGNAASNPMRFARVWRGKRCERAPPAARKTRNFRVRREPGL